MATSPLDERRFRDVIAGAYKSFDHPDFSFVERVFDARPYEPLIKRLRDFAVVEELTEAADDVCFGFLLKGQSALWKLDLSVVGPFGLFVRLKSRISAADLLGPGTTDLTGFETKVVDLLTAGGIKLLAAPELSIEIPMTLYNTDREKVRLYQALFSDRERLPWEA